MKSLYYIKTLILSLSVITVSSCRGDDDASDTTKPVIQITEPEEEQQVLIGSTNGMHIEMDLSDNVMLKSYKIEIHNNFDHHSHQSRSTTTDFTFNRSYDLSGQKNAHIHQHDVIIPQDATPGDYHLIIYCTDKAGNEAYVARDITLSTTASEDID